MATAGTGAGNGSNGCSSGDDSQEIFSATQSASKHSSGSESDDKECESDNECDSEAGDGRAGSVSDASSHGAAEFLSSNHSWMMLAPLAVLPAAAKGSAQ